MPYLPILDLLRDHCCIAEDNCQETCLAKVRASLQQVGLNCDASLPYVLPILGVAVEADPLAPLSAKARKARTFEAVRQLFLASSRHQPVVLAVENLHRIDPTSEALLASLVDGLAGAAIMLLATFRPGYRPLWLDKSYATQLALHPLGFGESQQVVRRVLRDKALPPTLEQQLLAKAEGNPFFLEELAYTLREHGEGRPALVVPDPIQAVLAARMDRLPTPSASSCRRLRWSAKISPSLCYKPSLRFQRRRLVATSRTSGPLGLSLQLAPLHCHLYVQTHPHPGHGAPRGSSAGAGSGALPPRRSCPNSHAPGTGNGHL
jgi:hypothetical protein